MTTKKEMREKQTHLVSSLEAGANVLSGFLISWMVWMFIAAPLFGYEVRLDTGFAITCLFTVSSLIRAFLWRRFFENDLHKVTVKLVAKWYNGQTKSA